MAKYEVTYYDASTDQGKNGKKSVKTLMNISEVKYEKGLTTFVSEDGNDIVFLSGKILDYKKLTE